MGYRPFPDAEYQPSATDRNRGYRLDQIGGKYAYDFSSALRFSASFTHTEGYVDYLRPTSVASAVNFRNEELATAKLDWLPSQAFQVFLKGYWHDWSSHYDETDNLDLAAHTTEHVDDYEFWGFHDYGVNAVAKFVPTGGIELYGGYDLQKYGGRDDVLLIAQQNETANAVFGQLRLTPELIPRVHLAAGVRYNDVGVGQSATVWNVSGQVDITDNLYIRANGGAGFRLPDAESLFAQDPINNGEVGNPNLKPERSRSINGSIGGRFMTSGGVAEWELIGFARATKDLISLDGPTADPDVLTFVNTPDEVKVTGFEATLDVPITRDWSINGSYTHAHAREAGASLQFVGIPEDYAQGGVDWHPANLPIGGSFLGNWVGEVAENVSSGFGRVERGHYAVFDLNAYVDFGRDRKQRLAVRLENLFDAGYATHVSRAFTDATGDAYLVHYLGTPRTLHVSFTAKL
jgi:vitamin B12 transporter